MRFETQDSHDGASDPVRGCETDRAPNLRTGTEERAKSKDKKRIPFVIF